MPLQHDFSNVGGGVGEAAVDGPPVSAPWIAVLNPPSMEVFMKNGGSQNGHFLPVSMILG